MDLYELLMVTKMIVDITPSDCGYCREFSTKIINRSKSKNVVHPRSKVSWTFKIVERGLVCWWVISTGSKKNCEFGRSHVLVRECEHLQKIEHRRWYQIWISLMFFIWNFISNGVLLFANTFTFSFLMVGIIMC